MDYAREFTELRAKLDERYYSADHIPYHALETCVVEAQDHGHVSTSEAASLYVYMEALNGYLTGDWEPLRRAWDVVEKHYIHSGDFNYSDYNPASPAMYAPEMDTPDQYPVQLTHSVPPGRDPIGERLKAAYGSQPYTMHWLIDPDNVYGMGPMINTFQRGPLESCWKTVPHPCVDTLEHGGVNGNGFLDLFTSQEGAYPAQTKLTLASDADARCIQGIFWAKYLADKRGGSGVVDDLVARAVKMGDWLAYTFYDKYFLQVGTQDARAPSTTEDGAFHGLLAWYSAYGGPLQKQGWAFRIGCSHSHSGYQNVLAAFAMARHFSGRSVLQGLWERSLWRQIELYCWLQSAEGALAGGVTNSWNGRYDPYPAGTRTFYGMAYVPHPVYHDPPSNQWSGIGCWGVERVVQLYYLVRDARMGAFVRGWVRWVVRNSVLQEDGGVLVPLTLRWTGQPDADWSGPDSGKLVPSASSGLTCEVTGHGRDLGVVACMARCLLFFHATRPSRSVKRVLDAMLHELRKHKGDLGYSTQETREDYRNFDVPVHVPSGWVGTTARGDAIEAGATFFSLRRSLFEGDPMYAAIRESLDRGEAPSILVHRYWAQAEIAITLGFAALFEQQNGPMGRIMTTA